MGCYTKWAVFSSAHANIFAMSESGNILEKLYLI
jgi:hypothetical protein